MLPAGFHEDVARWFGARFGEPTAPQAAGWPKILAGRDVLIAAPTGSGKTLAAFLACLDHLLERARARTLEDKTYAVYVSPLRALSNDVSKNLAAPLAELTELARREDSTLPEIRVAVRTGDTPQGDRARMARVVPHILVTTPESLYIMLTSPRARERLADARVLIVDEIHAMADDKRGAHLSLTLERLDALVEAHGHRRPQRIGLSATQKPIETVAAFLGGAQRPLPEIVDAGAFRNLDLSVEVPSEELGAVASKEMMGEVYDRIAALAMEHRTTLVFANTRKLVERVAHALGERIGEELVAPHHGSLSRAMRLRAEERLKQAQARVVVATASLELGIDVGAVELVVQLGSPRSIATFLQRVGRSGHSLGATPKGRLFATTRDQLVECAALIRAVRAGELDALEVPSAPLDVLAQQIVAMVSGEDWTEDALFAAVTRAYPYRALTRQTFDQVVEMLAEGITLGKGRTEALVHRDRVHGVLKGRRRARLVAITSGGAIPDTADYAVIADPDETFIGTLHEDFAIESMAGDIFLLGNTSWRIRRVEAGRVRVEDAQGAPPSIPFWLGEAPARTRELSSAVSRLRLEVEAHLEAGGSISGLVSALETSAALPTRAAEQLVEYLVGARVALGAMPTEATLVAERFFDEGGGMQLVLHAPLGARLNRAFGLALRKRFCRSFNFELQAAATDDGIVISLGPMHSFPLETIFEFLSPETVRHVLQQAVLDAPVFGVRWRWNAQRALAIPRRVGGKKVPPPILRMRSDDLLAAVFPMAQACAENIQGEIEIPDHPLVFETMYDCLHEAMDIEGLEQLLRDIRGGRVRTVARDTTEPSALAHELLSSNPYSYLDDAPLEERRTRAVSLRRRGLPADLEAELGALDTGAIREVEAEVAPDIRDEDELHDVLLSLGLWPLAPAFLDPAQGPNVPLDAPAQGSNVPLADFFARLLRAGRATVAEWTAGERTRAAWVAAEKVPLVRAAIPGLRFQPELPPLPYSEAAVEPEQAHVAIVRGHLAEMGPVSAGALAERLGLPEDDVFGACLRLEAEGAILRGRFTPGSAGIEWCERRILARIHRMTLGKLRREIEPVTPADLLRFLFRWQHAFPSAQLAGPRGTLEVIAQLEGLELPAGAWERDVLKARVRDYDSAHLDALSASGEVVWGRIDPRDPAEASLSRATPIAILLRDDLPWLLRAPPSPEAPAPKTEAARVVLEVLERRGASFVRELATLTRRSLAEIEQALRELVATGLVTADAFAGLRALLERSIGEQSASRHVDRFDAPRIAPLARGSRYRVEGPRAEPAALGRWSVLRNGLELIEDREAETRLLLARYGVVFRDLLARESRSVSWRDHLGVLRRMEARGEVRGGRFVSGFVGEQFALPEAVEALRALRRDRKSGVEWTRIAAVDPLNLVGILTPGPRVPAVGDNAVLFRDGVPVASREGGRLIVRAELGPEVTLDAELTVRGPSLTNPLPHRPLAPLRSP